MGIAERIASERKRLGLSQAEFAGKAGISLSSQKRYEKGERDPDTVYLEAIGKAGVDVGYVMGHSKWTPDQKLESALYAYKVGPTGELATDILGNEVPGLDAHYGGGEGIGWLFLCALGIADADWNRIAEKLIRLDETGTPQIDGSNPAWGQEIARVSRFIQGAVDEASALDSSLLTGVLEGVDLALSAQSKSLAPRKKAQAVAMLYRAFKGSGKVDQAMIDEAVRLAAT